MDTFQNEWNNEPDFIKELEYRKISAKIGYFFKYELQPRGVTNILKGCVMSVGDFDDG